MTKLSPAFIQSIIKERLPDSNKGTYGHTLLIAGNKAKMGAAVIAAMACLRSGVGLLTVAVPYAERSILQTAVPEAMLVFREDFYKDFNFFSAIGIGPGIGKSKKEKNLLTEILQKYKNPIVLDADVLNIMSASKKMLNNIPLDTIITPHPKEFDRLFGIHISTEDRIKTATKKALEMNIVVVLKGHNTFLTDGTKLFINITGNSGLAKGGSGDALTGLISGLLAQGYTAMESAILGVYIHGLAADITLKTQSMESMIITDVIENFGEAFKQISMKLE